MVDDEAGGPDRRAIRNPVQAFRKHVVAFAGVNCALFVIDLLTPGSWWFFWPMLGWGAALAFHYMYLKGAGVDEGWADRKAREIRHKAYDASHIEDIDKRYAGAGSPEPPALRPGDPKAGRE